MKCTASEVSITSARWMLLPYSWLMRWKTRSDPARSTCTLMPGYFSSKALPTLSET
jgi:hypothetical protein